MCAHTHIQKEEMRVRKGCKHTHTHTHTHTNRLRGTLVSQGKAYLKPFHAAKMTEMADALEAERWDKVSIPHAVSVCVCVYVSCIHLETMHSPRDDKEHKQIFVAASPLPPP
jgi:hypothetical protein